MRDRKIDAGNGDFWHARHQERLEIGVERPPLDKWQEFLDKIPKDGRVLELGAGLGDYSFAMSRQRPDITYMMMDLSRDALLKGVAGHIEDQPGDFRHEILSQTRFESFTPIRDPSQKPDGIFANNALFFAPPAGLEHLLANLALSLKPSGVLRFNYIPPSSELNDRDPFPITVYPMAEDALCKKLEKAGFQVDDVHSTTQTYTPDKISLPTLFISAHKKPSLQ